MKKTRLNLSARSYDIVIGSGAVKRLPATMKTLKFAGPVVVITDKTVRANTAKSMDPVLKKLPNEVHVITVPSSERAKSIEIFQDTVQKISKKTRTHRPLIAALGGGVVGDLGGFVAATYRRGVPLIQIPTTLLAQVDSSVGGKVGVDLPEAKNLVGAFCQPKAVLMDTDLLSTLPVRQIRNGLAEVIKYGIIAKRSFFEYLEDNIRDVLALKRTALEKVIFECASIKARVVEKDELDVKDIRIDLNFGHTLGHAIEAAAGYSNLYNHGESVAVGMVLAGEMAVRLDMMKRAEFDRMKALLVKAGLPVSVKGLSLRDILQSHAYDKKFTSGSNRFVLPRRIGKVTVVEDIPELLIKSVLREYTKK